MDRRRNPHKVALTSIAISIETLDLISKSKIRRETYDHLIKRLFIEWKDLKEYRLDMDQVIRLKDRKILNLENELKEKQLQQNL